MLADAKQESAAALSPDLAVRGLSKTFPGGVTVFSDVSFEIARGQAVALVGANGTGKSTLLRCCLGLIAPTAGDIQLLGSDMKQTRGRRLREVRAQVGMVAQKHFLSPRLSVLSNVIHGLLGSHSGPRYWLQSLAPQEAREKAMRALDLVGLSDFAERRADKLSGGQSQRVAIARALVSSPRLLIADEPAASLDPASGEDVMNLFFRLMREQGVTVLFTSHHIAHALDYADHVFGLRDGALMLDAPAASVEPSELRRLYG